MSLFGARNTQEYNIIQRKRHSDMSKICCRIAFDLTDDGVVLAKMREKCKRREGKGMVLRGIREGLKSRMPS